MRRVSELTSRVGGDLSDVVVGPALVSAVAAGQSELALGWLRSAQHWLGQADMVSTGSVNMLVLWDLGMSRYERELVNKHCNTSVPQCSIIHFDWSR